ncbi:MAG: AAA domain-containing protein [Acidobacteria bacterium]|nr:AAA domain-containing protein [Acidobacteriota bacterium]
MSHPVVSTNPKTPERPLSATRLAQYVTARQRCERYLRFALFPSECDEMMDRYDVHHEPLSPLLAEAGNIFEKEAVAQIASSQPVIDLQNKDAKEFVEALRKQIESRALYYQVRLEGRIGQTSCEGIADLIEITRDDHGSLTATVIDIKASRRESINFRLQITFYARLLKETLALSGLRAGAVNGAIISRDSVFSVDTIERFELGLYEDEIERLIASPQSDVERVKAGSFSQAGYHLSAKCDGCPYNPICFIDTTEREDLSLVPLLTATEKRSLLRTGVKSVRELADLMTYGQRNMIPASGRESDVTRISHCWPLGGKLPLLVQRARAAVKMFDPTIELRPYLLGSGFGSLPDSERYPDLVRIFIDAQRDYIEDRIYLIAALVATPDRIVEVVEMTEAPPDVESERALLLRWLTRLLSVVAEVTATDLAPMHVYLFDRRDQSVLLDALTRHFDALCAIPAFYDLLTSSPALTQAMISFLADEVRERRNLAPICQNLYRVASAMGFEWRENELDFWQRFRARAFGYRQSFKRDPQTGQFEKVKIKDGPGVLHVESAARFGTQIPLEYAYVAWGKVNESEAASQDELAQMRGFLGVTADEIRRLAAHRCRALHYIEQQFPYKNRFVDKSPLDLARLDEVEIDSQEIPLNRSLENFLLLEHYAKYQSALINLAQSPELRAQTGGTAILRCDSYSRDSEDVDRGTFSFVTPNGQPVNRRDFGALRLQEGAWTVLNPLSDEEGGPRSASAIIRGRLCVIERIDETRMELRLLRMNFKRSRFRYGHRTFDPQAGSIYTLDGMVDDLNAEKYLEACRNASHNQLYQWLNEAYLDPARSQPSRVIRPSRLRLGKEIAGLAAQSQKPHGLTEAQREIVGERLTDSVLIVQGPPGSGKSHTIGFAILARVLALKTQVRPFRVAVAARTHAAVEIVLDSVVKRMTEIVASHSGDSRLDLLKEARIVKVGNDPGESVPGGVELILAEGADDQSAGEQWHELMSEKLLIIGGTPGGLYRLIKQGTARGRELDWTEEHFDLVVIDEASQMSITEAITAAAFLRSDGQFIAVGDHRQMPPILAHAWDRDYRRDLQRARPHLSIFEYLIDLGFPRIALDESFRIPAEIADFLNRHIYAQDGIDYRSQNRNRLAQIDNAEEWIVTALAPDHPLILLEHDEEGSQQANEYEAELIEPLIQVAVDRLRLDSSRGLGIVVPHRAQKALLQNRLPAFAEAIDTVERFQGSERDLIIVSATVSDREYALTESSFLLEPRRLTVAVSRPKKKLIVLASRNLFDLIPTDLDEYERGSLWKHLRRECAKKLLWKGQVGKHGLSVYSLAAFNQEEG